jgi:hypothetical protein
MPGKERQPSSNTLVLFPALMTWGLTSTISSPFPFSPASLNTISRTLTPTCGAASPTPSSLQAPHSWRLEVEEVCGVQQAAATAGIGRGPRTTHPCPAAPLTGT